MGAEGGETRAPETITAEAREPHDRNGRARRRTPRAAPTVVTPELVAFTLGVFFVSAFLKGITGLGFSTICIGLLAAMIDLKVAIPLLILPSLASNVLVMIEAGRFRQALARFWPLYLSAVPGIALGLWALDASDANLARTALGAVLAGYGVFGLSYGGWRLPAVLERPLSPVAGLVTGVINGLTGSQVMPVLPYLMSLGLDRDLFVQAINVFFTFASLVMLIGLGRLGLLSVEVSMISILGIAPVAAGIWSGAKLRRRLSETTFRTSVLCLLIGLGVALVVASL